MLILHFFWIRYKFNEAYISVIFFLKAVNVNDLFHSVWEQVTDQAVGFFMKIIRINFLAASI